MNTLVDDAKQHGTAVGLPVDRITIDGGKPLRGRIELKGAKIICPTSSSTVSFLSVPSTQVRAGLSSTGWPPMVAARAARQMALATARRTDHRLNTATD